MLSSTVTVAEHVLELPFTSVTVNVTVLSPTSSQSKLVISNERLSIPQASLDPLSMSVVVIDAAPLASSCTVTS